MCLKTAIMNNAIKYLNNKLFLMLKNIVNFKKCSRISGFPNYERKNYHY